jgi:hypothetical protein
MIADSTSESVSDHSLVYSAVALPTWLRPLAASEVVICGIHSDFCKMPGWQRLAASPNSSLVLLDKTIPEAQSDPSLDAAIDRWTPPDCDRSRCVPLKQAKVTYD